MSTLCLRILTFCMLAQCGIAITGCQYQQHELYDDQYQTVSLPIFKNKTFYRGVETQLTEAIAKELELRTPYKVVYEKTAETSLTGTITSIDQALLSRTFRGGIAEEVQVRINVSFEWKDARTGHVIRKRGQITGTGEFLPRRGVGEPLDVAKHDAIMDLSREIVSAMRKDW